jgi:hypothetical protein
MVDGLERQMSVIPTFEGLQSLLDGRSSNATELTIKECRELTRLYLLTMATLLIHHQRHVEALLAGIDFKFLACYQSLSDTTIRFLEKSLQNFDKLKWAFEK